MAVLESYTQLGLAEDVEDIIYMISPVDAPVAAMARTIQATGRTHEWTEESLNAAASNKKIEGAAAGADSSTPVVPKSNYCQIMEKVAEVSGTLERVKKYGRDSEMAHQLSLRYMELANDEELAIMGTPGGTRQTGNVGAAGTAREMKALFNQLDAGVVVDSALITLFTQLEDDILEAHLATYNAGGNPKWMSLPPALASHIAALSRSSGRTRDLRSEKQIVNVIDLYVSFYGELNVMLDRNQETGTIALLDPEYLATPVLRPTDDWELAKVGDSFRRQIIRESTFAVLNSEAHALVDNVPASLS